MSRHLWAGAGNTPGEAVENRPVDSPENLWEGDEQQVTGEDQQGCDGDRK